ncbi:MAG: ABC transporter permease [Bdellovibrio sp.]|nr:MAG: ABC transporter permease [Bdellovibrio sp.]
MVWAFFEAVDLVGQTLWQAIKPPYRFKDVIQQLYFVAVGSAPIVIFSVAFAAIVTIIEASFHMKLVIKNDALVPGFAALLILRELGPVVTALLLTSRVGAGIASEVGTMKVTEQIDALKMLGIHPIKFIVVPRFLACLIGGVLLTSLSNGICLFSAVMVSKMKLGYTTGYFLSGMRVFVEFQDFLFALVKGFFFGGIIPLMSCFYGFRCRSGAEGVGRATTKSVVSSSVAIIIVDFILSWVFSYLY